MRLNNHIAVLVPLSLTVFKFQLQLSDLKLKVRQGLRVNIIIVTLIHIKIRTYLSIYLSDHIRWQRLFLIQFALALVCTQVADIANLRIEVYIQDSVHTSDVKNNGSGWTGLLLFAFSIDVSPTMLLVLVDLLLHHSPTFRALCY